MPHAGPKRHGELKYFLVDEDVFAETPQLKNGFRLDITSGLLDATKPLPPVFSDIRPARLFRFGRMFRKPNLPEFRPDPDDLIKLGEAMKEDTPPVFNRNLPAGYTLLGQFIDHDITFDASEDLSYGALQPHDQETKRSPSLDLDSLYGLPPLADVMQTDIGALVYQPDRTSFAVGKTIRDNAVSPPVLTSFPNDLPRRLDDRFPPEMAMVIDPRNDENTAVAQMHLAFIKFHNVIVQRLSRDGVQPSELLNEARKFVVQHYQWIILEDYLPRIIDGDILNDVMDNGCRHFEVRENEEFMPVEFSVAAFRLGHPMVTETYEWNRYFQSDSPRRPARLPQLFVFTGSQGNNFKNLGRLPSSWIIDWTRFFDFSDLGINSQHSKSFARPITPFIVHSLAELPFFPVKDKFLSSLAVRNLLRGRLLGLPSGQAVAERLGVTDPLTPDEIAVGSHLEILRGCGFDKLTPLWYYILREAQLRKRGERLGEVGSRIIAETFVKLIKSSRISILPKDTNGRPLRPALAASGRFTMADLLHFVDRELEGEDFLNPLG